MVEEPVVDTPESPLASDRVGPNFANPPVAEVALGVYFEPLTSVRTTHLGGLWTRWRERYPTVEEQPALPPLTPERPGPQAPQITFQLSDRPLPPRIWYLGSGGNELVQFQQDRLVHNWRRTKADEPYPHYERIRPAFVADLKDLETFIEDEALGTLQPFQCEVTYVNPVPISSIVGHRGFEDLIAPWSGQNSDDFLPAPETVALVARYPIIGADGTWLGRLYVTAEPVWRQEEGTVEEVVMLQVFARGAPLGEGLEGVLRFLELGHEWVVNGFASITTPEMQRVWGRRND